MTVILATQNAGESCELGAELGASLDYTAKIHLKKKRKIHTHTLSCQGLIPQIPAHNFHLLQSYLFFKVQIQGPTPFS